MEDIYFSVFFCLSFFLKVVNNGTLQWVRGIIDKVKIAGVFHRELGFLSASLVCVISTSCTGEVTSTESLSAHKPG